jgi:hypothetical protein
MLLVGPNIFVGCPAYLVFDLESAFEVSSLKIFLIFNVPNFYPDGNVLRASPTASLKLILNSYVLASL